ncbi:MAG TPA: FAD-dependent oxidoreductase [Nocardioides sp.]
MKMLIVGGGVGAASAADELRNRDKDVAITVLAGEPHLPYEKPPLSKDVLLGTKRGEQAILHDHEWYAERRIDVHVDAVVTDVDLEQRRVSTASGETLAYDRLLLATGAVPRRLALADDSGAPTAYLRTIEDAERLRTALMAGPASRIVIIGGGWIGLEVAAAARIAGARVTVVESFALPLLRALGPRVARTFADLHREHGVDLRLGASITRITAGGTVHLADGSALESDLVVVGVGAEPDDALARSAGLECDNGILVDAWLRTSDPQVFAVGDVANHDHPVLGRRLRVEHWDTAVRQARAAAGVMLGGEEPYAQQPYFFTDQFDVGIEFVGSLDPQGAAEVVVRGGEQARTFQAFWLRGNRVMAAMHVNQWDAIDSIRAVVGREVDVVRLRDSSVPVSDALS